MMTIMQKKAIDLGKKRLHATWADVVVLLTGVIAAVGPEVYRIGADSWATLGSPSNFFSLLVPTAAVGSVWARKFTVNDK